MDPERARSSERPRADSRQLPWQLAAVGILVVSACAALTAYAVTESQTPGSGVFAGVIMVLCGLAASLGIGLLGPPAVSIKAVAFATLGSVFLPTLLIGVFVPAYQRSRCGTWIFVAQEFLLSYHQRAFEAIEVGEEFPASIALWVADGEVSDTFFTTPLCGRFMLNDIQVGEWTLGNLQRGDVTRAQLGEAAQRLLPGDWERVGPFLVCRDAGAIRSRHPGLIIGFQHEAEPNREYWAFVFANSRTGTYWANHLDFIVAADAAARRELGLSPIPEVGPIAIEMARIRAMETPEEQKPE
ncbi:MAG: hypothetical protein ACF8QF_02710 [Phycisphaerales bacterium]